MSRRLETPPTSTAMTTDPNSRQYHTAQAYYYAAAAQKARTAGDWRTANKHANLSGYHASAIALTSDEVATEPTAQDAPQANPNDCHWCAGTGNADNMVDCCGGCGGSGRKRLGYWNNYGRDNDNE